VYAIHDRVTFQLMRSVIVAASVALALAGCQKKDKDAAPAASEATACASDNDRVFSCDVQGSCCDDPYCETVQLKAVAAANRAYNQSRCTDAQRAACPAVGTRAEPDYTVVARCGFGKCLAEKVPKTATAWRNPGETVDDRGYARSCKADDDCRIVDELPCNHCNCGAVSIAATEVDRFLKASAAIECGPQPKMPCHSCRGFLAVCQAGTCDKKPAPL
jgi:hypothetical protein